MPVYWLFLLGVYQLVSALGFGMPLENVFAFDFLRRDGKFYIAYAPLLFGAVLHLRAATLAVLVRSMVAMAGMIAAVGLAEYALAIIGVHAGLLVRIGADGNLYFLGLNTTHNATASFFAVTGALVYGQLLVHNWRGTLFWMVLGVLVLAVALTLSRSFVLAIAMVGGVATFTWGRRRHLIGALAFGIVVLPFLGGGLLGRFAELRSPEEVRNVALRLVYWQRAGEYVIGSPWLGIGFSRFNDEPASELGGIPGIIQFKKRAPVVNNDLHAHNALLMSWAEGGLLGVSLWIAFLGSLFRHLIRLYRQHTDRFVRGLSLGVLLAFGTVLAASIVANNIVTPSAIWPAGFFAGALLGVKGVLRPVTPRRFWKEPAVVHLTP
jgi:O-antigen ligase